MSKNTPILSYMAQLNLLARQADKSLLTAFLEAGVADSTFYRAQKTGHVRYDTAARVAEALHGETRSHA